MRSVTAAWLVVVGAGLILLFVGLAIGSEQSRAPFVPDPPPGYVFDELPRERKLHRAALVANTGGGILIVVGLLGAAITQFKAPPLASRAPGFPVERRD